MSPRSCGHRLRPGPDPTPEPKEPPDSTPPVRRHRPRGPQAAGSPSRTPKTLPKDRIWARRGGSPSYPSRGGHCPLPSHRAPPGRHLEARPPRPRAVHAGTRWSPAPHPRRPLQPGGARVARWSRSRGRRLPSADLPLLGPPRRGAEAQTNGRRAREREPQLEMHGIYRAGSWSGFFCALPSCSFPARPSSRQSRNKILALAGFPEFLGHLQKRKADPPSPVMCLH
nr:four-jointed box protein 1 isoform X3 [Manis javanica]